jgi:membrane fusion protein (multidrug efflux system)
VIVIRSIALLAAVWFVVAPAQAEGVGEIRVLLTPELETTLASPMLGRVHHVNVSLGSSFEKGDALVDFFCDEQVARERIARAEVAGARENYEAKLRLQGLQSAGEVEVAIAAAALDRARGELQLAHVQKAKCIVSAPFSGRAVKVNVKPHQGVSAGQPLVEIVSRGQFKLRLNVPSKWLAWLKPGTPFEVKIDETGRTYAAKVTAINARVDAASQSVELEGSITEGTGELLAGMSGTALFKPPQ